MFLNNLKVISFSPCICPTYSMKFHYRRSLSTKEVCTSLNPDELDLVSETAIFKQLYRIDTSAIMLISCDCFMRMSFLLYLLYAVCRGLGNILPGLETTHFLSIHEFFAYRSESLSFLYYRRLGFTPRLTVTSALLDYDGM